MDERLIENVHYYPKSIFSIKFSELGEKYSRMSVYL